LDTDPSVPLNAMIADSYTAELAVGLDLLSKLTGTRRIWITADPDKPAAWFSSVKLRILNPGLKFVPLRGDYPQTDPTLMLFTLLQRRLAPQQLPTEKGVLLIDAAAAVALGQCAINDGPVVETPLAMRDHFQQKTHLVEIPIGARLADVCEFLQMNQAEAVFRAGDFLRDQWITSDTTLGHGELVIHATASHLDANPDPCIRCGWCLEACPMRIHPAGLLDAAQHNDARAAKKFGVNACIECGICSYVCPTRLPLLTAIRGLKTLCI
jgi:electron transport complex protein RnfC